MMVLDKSAVGALAVALALLTSGAFAGCEDSNFEGGVRGTVQERLQARGEEGRKKIDALFAERDERIRSETEKLGLGTLEWDPEQEHPLVKWRKALNSEDKTPAHLKEHAPKYPGTPIEKAIPRYQTFFQSNDRYWKDTESGSLDEYWNFLEGYLAENPDGPFADDVMFDQAFVHARRQFELYKVKPENRVTSVFRYWQLAFDFENLPGEAFMPYIARLCEKDDDFRTYCRKIPFEFRHLAIMTPYYDALLTKLDELLTKHPDSPYKEAAEFLKQQFKEDQAKMAKEFEEYPILPESMAFLPANQRLNLVVGPRGLYFGDRPIEESADETFVLTQAKAKQLEEQVVNSLIEIREAGEPELRQGNIGVLAAKETPTESVLRLVWAPMLVPAEQQSQLNQASFLIGRRRFDYSNLKVANELQLVPKDAALELRADYPGGSANCKMMGLTGERPIELLAATSFVHIDASGKLRAGTLAVAAPPDVEDATGSPAKVDLEMAMADLDWGKLSAWATDQPGPIMYNVDGRVQWDLFVRALGPLAFKCSDDKCEKSQPRAQPNIYVGFCN